MARTSKGLIGPSTSLQLPWRFIFRAALGVALLLLLLLRLLVGQLVLVRGDLMAPLIHDGDVLVVRHARVPAVGDVVLLDLGDDAPPPPAARPRAAGRPHWHDERRLRPQWSGRPADARRTLRVEPP